LTRRARRTVAGMVIRPSLFTVAVVISVAALTTV
jgi:hypothetical protein